MDGYAIGTMSDKKPKTEEIWFVYDGQCPLCLMGATYFRIKESVGKLNLLDKRTTPDSHPLIQEINANRLDLDEGMVLKMGGRFYQGAEALNLMALIGTNTGWFNKFNASLFTSKRMARFWYPSMRATRNLLLRIKGVEKINNLGNVHE